MSTLATNAITDASGGNTATINGYTPTMSNMAGRNRIINGAMVFDQRNGGASVSYGNTGVYTLDRWKFFITQANKFTVQQNAGSVTPPIGFTNYMGITSTSAYSSSASDYFTLVQAIEGFNVSDFGWGTVNAKTVTLSFWVRSSLTGTFSGAITNSGYNRTYSFNYTISAANTWEQKVITIAGDTTGTWLTDNSRGLEVDFDLGSGSSYSGALNTWNTGWFPTVSGSTSVVGTSGATFYITGVQLEVGSVATPFEHRMYGTELQLCQRYFYTIGSNIVSDYVPLCSGWWRNNTLSFAVQTQTYFPVQMRAVPSVSLVTTGGGSTTQPQYLQSGGEVATCTLYTANASADSTQSMWLDWTPSVAASNNGISCAVCTSNNEAQWIQFKAEL